MQEPRCPFVFPASSESHPYCGCRFQQSNRPVLYTNLLVTGKLDQHLAENDWSCEEQLESIMQQLAEQEGVTEARKADNHMEWVRHMNNIQNRVEEILLSELDYVS